jgi:hypothetical protein
MECKLPDVLTVEAYGVDVQDQDCIVAWLKRWVKVPCKVKFLDRPCGNDPDAMITNKLKNTDVHVYGRPDRWGWWINVTETGRNQYGIVLRYPAVKQAWAIVERQIRELHWEYCDWNHKRYQLDWFQKHKLKRP